MYGDIVDYDADCAEKVFVTITRSSSRVIAFPVWDKFWKIDRLQIRFPTRLASHAYHGDGSTMASNLTPKY